MAGVREDLVRRPHLDQVAEVGETETGLRVPEVLVPFVGTDFIQDVNLGLCELKSPKYWESALLKVGKYWWPTNNNTL